MELQYWVGFFLQLKNNKPTVYNKNNVPRDSDYEEAIQGRPVYGSLVSESNHEINSAFYILCIISTTQRSCYQQLVLDYHLAVQNLVSFFD